MDLSKPPQRDREKLFLCGSEDVHCEALKKPSETAKEGNGYRSRLTRSKISRHSSASTRSKFEIKALPSLSSMIPAKVRTASPSSFALVTSFQSRWYSFATSCREGLGERYRYGEGPQRVASVCLIARRAWSGCTHLNR